MPRADMGGPFHLLSETERECLRLVHEGHSSKMIARMRRVRSDRIDKIVNAARGKLGGLSRRDAARRLVEHERQADGQAVSPQPIGIGRAHPAQGLGAQPLGLAARAAMVPDPVIATPVERRGMERGSDGFADWRDPGFGPNHLLALLIRLVGRQGDGLNRSRRLAMILVIAVMALLMAGGALNLLYTLDHLGSGA